MNDIYDLIQVLKNIFNKLTDPYDYIWDMWYEEFPSLEQENKGGCHEE